MNTSLEKEDEEILHRPFLDPPEKEVNEPRKKLMETIAGVAGNALEWYDFALFGSLSDIIGEVFFPPKSENADILESFIVFGVAFLVRPFGGMVIGYFGDKFGRKKALELSIFIMAFPTFILGCLPSYERIGWVATLLLVIVRIFQGLSVSGQIMSSLVFTVESHHKTKWGLHGSFVLMSAHIGALLGSLVSYVLRATLAHEQLKSWGWRVPFLSGIVVVLFALHLKYNCKEDHSGTSGSNREEEINPILATFSRENLRGLLSVTLVPMLSSAGFYVTFVWMAIYMTDLIHPSIPQAFAINSASLIISFILFFPFAGMLSDSYGRTKIMTYGGCSLAVLGPVMVYIIGLGDPITAFFAQTLLGILGSLWEGPMCAWLAESFPPELRLTSLSIGFNIAQAIVGGFSPVLATLMVDKLGVNSPGFLYSLVAIFSLIGLYIVPVHGVVSDTSESECNPKPNKEYVSASFTSLRTIGENETYELGGAMRL